MIIEENIDYDLDRKVDFFFSIDTKTNAYQLLPKTEGVKSLSQEGIMPHDALGRAMRKIGFQDKSEVKSKR